MFEDLINQSLSLKIKERGSIIMTPDKSEIFVMQKIWEMLSWIHESFLFEGKNVKDIGVNSKTHLRLTSLTISYTNHAYILEGTLKRSYLKFCKSMSY